MLSSRPSYAQDDGNNGGGDSKGKLEIGVLGSLLLPANFPGADEVYPSFGPHFALPTSFAVFELEAIYGIKKDRIVAKNNMILLVPLQMRKDIRFIGSKIYGSIGGHAVWFATHYSSGRRITGLKPGFNMGGGLIFPDKGLNFRLDMRFFVNPGTTVMIALVIFFNV
jgi:hypothetical protein